MDKEIVIKHGNTRKRYLDVQDLTIKGDVIRFVGKQENFTFMTCGTPEYFNFEGEEYRIEISRWSE
jgi:hypothetical protein